MTETGPQTAGAPTVRVRHFSPDPEDPARLVAGRRVQTIVRSALPGYQARGFAEVDADGHFVGEIPKADASKAPKATAAKSGGND